MVVCDFAKKGNVVRLFLCEDSDFDKVWGDDWDDAPYEHNAGEADCEFVTSYLDLYFKYDVTVREPADDCINSSYAKEDFKHRYAPCIVANLPQDEDSWWWEDCSYSRLVCLSDNTPYLIKIYFGDNHVDLIKKADGLLQSWDIKDVS